MVSSPAKSKSNDSTRIDVRTDSLSQRFSGFLFCFSPWFYEVSTKNLRDITEACLNICKMMWLQTYVHFYDVLKLVGMQNPLLNYSRSWASGMSYPEGLHDWTDCMWAESALSQTEWVVTNYSVISNQPHETHPAIQVVFGLTFDKGTVRNLHFYIVFLMFIPFNCALSQKPSKMSYATKSM